MRRTIAVLGSAAALCAGSLLTPASTTAAMANMARTIAVGDAIQPVDRTWSFDNPYTSARTPAATPAASHLDLVRTTMTYDPATRRLEVDWITSADITRLNCPVTRSGGCTFVADLVVVNSHLGSIRYEAFGSAWLGPGYQSVSRSSTYGPDVSIRVLRQATFGHHHVIWIDASRMRILGDFRLRPGRVVNGRFGSEHAATLFDPYFVDRAHDLASYSDWSDPRPAGAPDLYLG